MLIKRLNSIPDWEELSPKKLACVLSDFNVKPRQISQENNIRGYLVAHLKGTYLSNCLQ